MQGELGKQDARGERPVFGRYEILDTLGGGGMASVYRASLTGPAGAVRSIALKVIHPHLSGEPSFVRMFLDEMRVAMALQHRNIVQTLDVGQVGQRHFLAMELIPGCTLRQLLQRLGDRPLPLEIALFIGAEICSALHYAHTYQPELTGQPAAVVHRDVSPSNVLISTDGDVKLADFGVARARDSMRQQSISEAIKGKLAYMPPEQARGRAEARSDIFALAAMLYEMLSRRPLRQATTLEDVLEGPSALTPIHALRPEAPPELDALLGSCLDPDPTGRPDSALILGQVLHEMLGSLQQRCGQLDDMRARLAALVAALPPAPQGDPAALRLAQALLAEAHAVQSISAGGATAGPTQADTPSALERRDAAALSRAALSQLTDPYASPLAEVAGSEFAWKGGSVPGSLAVPPIGATTSAETAVAQAPSSISNTAALARRARSPWPWVALVLGLCALAGFGLWLVLHFFESDQRTIATRGFGAAAPHGHGATGDARLPGDGPKKSRESGPATRSSGAVARRLATGTPAAATQSASRKPHKPRKPRRRRKGRLSINATRWVRVVVDGKDRGATPLQEIALTAGRHTVRLVDPKTRKVLKVLRLHIRSGRTTTRIVQL